VPTFLEPLGIRRWSDWVINAYFDERRSVAFCAIDLVGRLAEHKFTRLPIIILLLWATRGAIDHPPSIGYNNNNNNSYNNIVSHIIPLGENAPFCTCWIVCVLVCAYIIYASRLTMGSYDPVMLVFRMTITYYY